MNSNREAIGAANRAAAQTFAVKAAGKPRHRDRPKATPAQVPAGQTAPAPKTEPLDLAELAAALHSISELATRTAANGGRLAAMAARLSLAVGKLAAKKGGVR
jgi:hypothetical protein